MFNSLEKGSKVACAETLMVSSLDDFVENCGLILRWLSEDLEEVTLIVVVDEDLLLLEDVNVLLNLDVDLAKTRAKVIIICVGYLLQEFYTTCLHALYSCDDIFSAHGDVLDARATVVVAVLLHLGDAESIGWFVEWHLNTLVEVGHYC